MVHNIHKHSLSVTGRTTIVSKYYVLCFRPLFVPYRLHPFFLPTTIILVSSLYPHVPSSLFGPSCRIFSFP